MRKYTIDEIIESVKQELAESNEIIGKKKKLYNKDYFVIGVITSAAKRLGQLAIDKSAQYVLEDKKK